jgi:hypothetical protein
VTAITPVSQTSSALVGTDKRMLVAIEPGGFAKVASLPDYFFSDISPGGDRRAREGPRRSAHLDRDGTHVQRPGR